MMLPPAQRYIPLLLLGIFVASCTQKPQNASTAPQSLPPLPVSVLTVHSEKLPAHISVVGQTEGSKDIEVRARVGGWLVKQQYHEGSMVKAGEPLFQLDRAPFEIAVAQAHATLNEAKAHLIQARRESKRLHDLLAKHAVSAKEADDASTTQQLAEATLESAQATLRQAELNLSYTTITAPESGLSGRAVHTIGNLIGTDTATSLLTTIVQTNPIRARFSITENDIAQLGIQQLTPQTVGQINLILPDGTVYSQPGKLDFLASQIDPSLGTRTLRAEFYNPDLKVLPGQFVRIRLAAKALHDVFLVPQVAVQQNEAGFFVFVADAHHTVSSRQVETGEWSGKNWIVTHGLNNGDQVIIDNIIKLKPGMAVTPHPAKGQ